jgi:hypothetical protein
VHEGASVRAVAEKTGQDPTGRIEANKRIRSARELSLFSSTAISQPIDDLFGDSTESPAAKKKADDWEARFNKEELRRIKIREAAERMRQQTHKTQRVRKKSRQVVR